MSRALLQGGVPPERLAVVEIVPGMADHHHLTLPGVSRMAGDAEASQSCNDSATACR